MLLSTTRLLARATSGRSWTMSGSFQGPLFSSTPAGEENDATTTEPTETGEQAATSEEETPLDTSASDETTTTTTEPTNNEESTPDAASSTASDASSAVASTLADVSEAANMAESPTPYTPGSSSSTYNKTGGRNDRRRAASTQGYPHPIALLKFVPPFAVKSDIAAFLSSAVDIESTDDISSIAEYISSEGENKEAEPTQESETSGTTDARGKVVGMQEVFRSSGLGGDWLIQFDSLTTKRAVMKSTQGNALGLRVTSWADPAAASVERMRSVRSSIIGPGSGRTVVLTGLPYRRNTTDDIRRLMRGFEDSLEHVELLNNTQGLYLGRALVRFSHADEAYRAVREKHRNVMNPGGRVIHAYVLE